MWWKWQRSEGLGDRLVEVWLEPRAKTEVVRMGRGRPARGREMGGNSRQGWPVSILLTLLALAQHAEVDAACSKLFQSTGEPNQAVGRFEAPSRVGSKVLELRQGSRKNVTRPTMCLYKFVAGPGEQVALRFSSFWLRGDQPECNREYVDVYANLHDGDQLEGGLTGELPNSRFCTSVMPRDLISLHNVIVLAIYTELEPPPDERPLFAGSFEFLKPGTRQIGPPEAGQLCVHTIESSSRREGEFQSVTYPGVYVKGLRCSYRFLGQPGERIRLEFLDLDLYSGGPHCPFDSIKIFDGPDEGAPLINNICGSHRSLIIYSTKEHLLLTFNTLEREAEIQNRGFSAYFEFSDKFFDTTFIQGPNAKHIRGSECDQRLLSLKGTTGSIVSPGPKTNPKAICRYIFEGLRTQLDYEKILLKFTEFDLKSPLPNDLQSSTTTQPAANLFLATQSQPDPGASGSAGNGSDSQCPDNYVRLYTSEQKPEQKQDPNDYDYVFCGNELPPSIESDAASLLMEFNSGSIGGQFRADYSFITDFRVPGIQTSPSCNFTYRSDNFKNGTFNSPRYPARYINDMNCSYHFQTKSDEALLLQFGTFKMENLSDETAGYGKALCKGHDLVEILEVTLDGSEQTEIGTYCGMSAPGPILSFKQLKVNFQTNKDSANYGFWGNYNFHPITELRSNNFVANCGSHVQASSKLRSGTISSPETYRPKVYEKRNHICSWNITARPSHRIALNLTKFDLEGKPAAWGCGTVSVRIVVGRSKVPVELCGMIKPENTSEYSYISDNEWLGVTFISTKQASGSKGFTADWSEIR